MHTLVRTLFALGLLGCAPTRILSATTIAKEPKRIYPQLATALQSAGYKCKDETDEYSFFAQCKGPQGGVIIEVKRKSKRPVLAQRFFFTNKACGTAEMNAKLEAFNLADAAGGNRAFCYEDKVIVSLESYLPTEGIEASELVQLVTTWEKSAANNAGRMGLMPAEDPGDKS